jgi:glutaryl-CoA dehydrogenase
VTDVSTALRRTRAFVIAAEFGNEERDYLRRTRAFVDGEVLPVINGFWENAGFPFDPVRRMGSSGWSAAASTTRACPR